MKDSSSDDSFPGLIIIFVAIVVLFAICNGRKQNPSPGGMDTEPPQTPPAPSASK